MTSLPQVDLPLATPATGQLVGYIRVATDQTHDAQRQRLCGWTSPCLGQLIRD